jgi:hypothetical protein
MKAILIKLRTAAPMKLKLVAITELRLTAQRKVVNFQEVFLYAFH